MPFETMYRKCREAIPWDYEWNLSGFRPKPDNVDWHNYSKIVAHLPFLEYLASQCLHITDFGTGDAHGTCALLAGCRGKVESYDLKCSQQVDYLDSIRIHIPCPWRFYEISTVDPTINIEPTDMLLIDSLHTYGQVKLELMMHAASVNRWLVFHETFSQGETSMDVPGQLGIKPAIREFLAKHPEWQQVYEVPFNHGLLLLEKKR
jgi:hypothetical protein